VLLLRHYGKLYIYIYIYIYISLYVVASVPCSIHPSNPHLPLIPHPTTYLPTSTIPSSATTTTRECNFSHTKTRGSWYMCDVNLVVSSITMYNICDIHYDIYYIKNDNSTLGNGTYITDMSKLFSVKFTICM